VDFLDVGWQEILLIIVVILIVFGPGRLVEVSRTLGRTFRALKNASSNLTAQVTKELDRENNSTGQQDKTGNDQKSAKS
jgi:sec-independent protein translocase protein TatA